MSEPTTTMTTLDLGDYQLTGTLAPVTYVDGTPGLQLITDEGPEILSVNLAFYGRYPRSANHIFVKAYSGHENLARELERQGLARIVDHVPIGYGHGYEVELLTTKVAATE